MTKIIEKYQCIGKKLGVQVEFNVNKQYNYVLRLKFSPWSYLQKL